MFYLRIEKKSNESEGAMVRSVSKCSTKNISLCLGYCGVLDFDREDLIIAPLQN